MYTIEYIAFYCTVGIMVSSNIAVDMMLIVAKTASQKTQPFRYTIPMLGCVICDAVITSLWWRVGA